MATTSAENVIIALQGKRPPNPSEPRNISVERSFGWALNVRYPAGDRAVAVARFQQWIPRTQTLEPKKWGQGGLRQALYIGLGFFVPESFFSWCQRPSVWDYG